MEPSNEKIEKEEIPAEPTEESRVPQESGSSEDKPEVAETIPVDTVTILVSLYLDFFEIIL